MAILTTRAQAIQQIAAGKAQHLVGQSLASGAITAAAATSGWFTISLVANSIGAVYPGTLTNIAGVVPSPSSDFRRVFNTYTHGTTAKCGWLAWLYKIGTLNLASTGNQFTHDAATFPVLRTKYGQASQPVNLIPLMYITTATTTTAPQFILETAAVGNGYVNQAGAGVTGTKTFTCPAAATAIQSGFILRLEDTDCAVQDMTQINVTVAGATGAATIYGMEILTPELCALVSTGTVSDNLVGSLGLNNIAPAVATSGTASAALVWVGTASATSPQMYDIAVRSTL